MSDPAADYGRPFHPPEYYQRIVDNSPPRPRRVVEVASYPISIFIAGSAADIEDQCRTYADEVGFCVTCTPTRFIYRDGEEDGYIVGLINYPRFPATPEQLWVHAEAFAERLRIEADQQSYTIQAPDRTVWYSVRPEDG